MTTVIRKIVDVYFETNIAVCCIDNKYSVIDLIIYLKTKFFN